MDDFETQAKIKVAEIYAKSEDPINFSFKIREALENYFKDDLLKPNPKLRAGIEAVTDHAGELFSEYENAKVRVSLNSFDKFIEFLKEVFGMETIDSKFVESISSTLATETNQVYGKHTAAVVKAQNTDVQQER